MSVEGPLTESRTLIISPNWIGDAVMAQPLLQLLRRQNPQRPIDVLAPPAVAPVWQFMQEVDTVITAPFRHGALQLKERWQYARRLRKNGYGSAYVLPNTLKFALIPWMAAIPHRVGYRGEMRYGLLNVIHRDRVGTPLPMVEFYAALANDKKEKFIVPRPKLNVAVDQIAQVKSLLGLPKDRPLIAFAPGAEFGSAKRWPTTHFAALAASIRQTHPNAQIVLLGSPKDKNVCDEIAATAPYAINLAGQTSLAQAIAIIADTQAVVSNDSGLLHIASALNRPIIALYGPTDPTHAPPFSDIAKSLSLNLSCSPCKQRECPLQHHDCMQKLSSDQVWSELKNML